MPRMGGNYGSYEGGSGLADLLSGAVSGFKTGSDLAAQRAAQKLAEEREARYLEDDKFRREQALLDDIRRKKMDEAGDAERALKGIVPVGGVDLEARTPNPEDRIESALGSIVRGGGIDLAPSVRRDGETMGTAETPDASGYNTRSKYSRVGENYAVDNTLTPEYRAGVAEAQGRDTQRQSASQIRALASMMGVPEEQVASVIESGAPLDDFVRVGRDAMGDRASAAAAEERHKRALEEIAARQRAGGGGSGGGERGLTPGQELSALERQVTEAQGDLTRVDRSFSSRPDEFTIAGTGRVRPGMEGAVEAWKADSASQTDAAREAVARAREVRNQFLEARGVLPRNGIADEQPTGGKGTDALYDLAAEYNEGVRALNALNLPAEEKAARMAEAQRRYAEAAAQIRGTP